MNRNIAIQLNHVSKVFDQSRNPIRHLGRLLLSRPPSANAFQAVRDISFTVNQGESIALIGQNGSGKSTTLQLVAGTLTPSSGTIQTQGRIAALLELGSGFNPEFTGRENVFFNARLLGMAPAEIEQQFDTIAEFADIGHYIEQPVKTYSSGMFVRLAFAVATHTNPDILIIDEALSVGDVFFQQKCFRKIRELQRNGATLMFVSHDPGSVQKLCDRAILLESGEIVADGIPRQVLEIYEAKILKRMDAEREMAENIAKASASESIKSFVNVNDVEILAVEVLDTNDAPIQEITNDRDIQFHIKARFHNAYQDIHFGLRIKNSRGEVIFETNTACMNCEIGNVQANEQIAIKFAFPVHFKPGRYTITMGVSAEHIGNGIFQKHLVLRNDQATLTIIEADQPSNWQGMVDLQSRLILA
jgi:lipopolysaccharide transport system ATP-binding protein